MSSVLLEGKELTKSYQKTKKDKTDALVNVNIAVEKNKMTVVLGPSGAGKSTLLNILSGLDKPDEGKVIFQDENISGWNEDVLTKFRQRYVGFVFQKPPEWQIFVIFCSEGVYVHFAYFHIGFVWVRFFPLHQVSVFS